MKKYAAGEGGGLEDKLREKKGSARPLLFAGDSVVHRYRFSAFGLWQTGFRALERPAFADSQSAQTKRSFFEEPVEAGARRLIIRRVTWDGTSCGNGQR